MTATFEALRKIVREIEGELEKARSAIHVPTWRTNAARRVKVYVDSHADGEIGKELHAMAVAEIERRAMRERTEILNAVSMRIEALRVVLPEMAAKACLDLGTAARDMLKPVEDKP